VGQLGFLLFVARPLLYQLRSFETETRGASNGARQEAYSGTGSESAAIGWGCGSERGVDGSTGREAEMVEPTYDRWRKEYGGLRVQALGLSAPCVPSGDEATRHAALKRCNTAEKSFSIFSSVCSTLKSHAPFFIRTVYRSDATNVFMEERRCLSVPSFANFKELAAVPRESLDPARRKGGSWERYVGVYVSLKGPACTGSPDL
jgi:hypothetical protein